MADLDLTKIQSTSLNPGFMNNDEYLGSFVINGSFSGGSKIITKTITLPTDTDIADIIFKGRSDGGFAFPTNNPRPNGAWFKAGVVYVRGDDAGAGYNNWPVAFRVYASISGDQLTLVAASFKQFIANLTLTAETVSYKIVDYSVF